MICPDCGAPLTPTNIVAKDKKIVEVDCCLGCGGIWMDHWEANQITLKSARDLGKKLFRSRKGISGSGGSTCPLCNTELLPFRAESIPLSCSVKYCPKCAGNWFPSGQLVEFKKAQESKLNYVKIWKIPIGSPYAILLPAVVFILIAGAIPATVALVQRRQEQRSSASDFVKSISIQNVSLDSVAVYWDTDAPVRSEIEIGDSPSAGQKIIVSAQPATTHRIKISLLTPGKKYFYRIILYRQDQEPVFLPFSSFIK